MSNPRKQLSLKSKEFSTSQQGLDVLTELQQMMSDAQYSTLPSYSPTSDDGILSFSDKHMTYLCSHLNVDPSKYLSNLRLITRVR